jgi:hypothetical protein
MLQHNDMTAPTTDPDPGTHAIVPHAHQSPVVWVVAARHETHTRTVPSFELESRSLLSLKRSRATFKWATALKTRTPRPRWLA